MRSLPIMKTDEHASIMASQTAFYSATVETVRRELVEYSIAVSNLDHETKEQRVQMAAVASYVRRFIEHHIDAKKVATPAEDQDDLNLKFQSAKLLRLFLAILEGYVCQCENCDPAYHQQIRKQAQEQAAENHSKQVDEEAVEDIRIFGVGVTVGDHQQRTGTGS